MLIFDCEDHQRISDSKCCHDEREPNDRHGRRRRSDLVDGDPLIGPLFVAISVASERLARTEARGQQGNSGAVDTIAILVVVCFVIGIGSAWELVGGPLVGIRQEVTELVRSHQHSAADSSDEEST